MSWYGERSCSRPAFLRSFGSWYQHDRTALLSIWCLWFHHRLQRLGWFWGLKFTFGKLGNAKVGISRKTWILPLPCYFGRKSWNHPLSAVKNVQEPDRGRSFWDSGNCHWDLGGWACWACWCHSIWSFNLIWFDANGEYLYFRGFDNPACVPPICTNDRFPTLVSKYDWCDCHRKHQNLVSWVLELRYSK